MPSKTLCSALFSGTALLCLLNGTVFAGQTTQVNVASNGTQPNSVGYNLNAQMNADGRYVTFTLDLQVFKLRKTPRNRVS